MAKKRKSTKKSEDLTQLLELSKPKRTKHTYTTITGQEYSIEIDDIFTIGKIEEAISDYFMINMVANKFASEEEIVVNSSLLFSILIQKFTDKNFITNNDPMDKFQKYTVVASTLHQIELTTGLSLYQQIILDFGEENLDKVKIATETFNQSLTDNKDQIQKMLQPLMEEGEEENGKEISESFELL